MTTTTQEPSPSLPSLSLSAAQRPHPATPPRPDSQVDAATRIQQQLDQISHWVTEPPAPFFPDHFVSIVIPVYNEEQTILSVVEQVLRLPLKMELIVVDDGSCDGTAQRLAAIAPLDGVRVLSHPKNRGKGAAIRSGLQVAEGDFIVIQDADLEYDSSEIISLLLPLANGTADAVYGSRFIVGRPADCGRLQYWGNRLLTCLSNQSLGLKLTDMETCYKAFSRWTLEGMTLQENRFGFEPEVTARLAHLGARIREMPVSYRPRSWAQGKKIGWRDLLSALRCIVRYRWAN